MANGLFNLKQQLQGLIQKAWSGQTPATYSGAFSGTYLTLGGQSTFAFGTNDFTIEGLYYFNNVTSEQEIFDFRPLSTQGAYPMAYVWTDSKLYYWVSSANKIISSITLSTGTWYHIAICRSGTSTKMFINGTQSGSTYTDTTNYLVGANRPALGVNASFLNIFYNGYISNFRIVNGTAVYTSNFTVPTAPLTAITNTVLLTLQSINIVDNSTNAYSITNVGGVLPDNKNPFNTPNVATSAVEYLVVAGGGGGNNGGGGAGGLLQGIVPITTGSAITVTVGAGGSSGGIGQNSVFGSITALGGGNGVGVSGGSGGGAGYSAGSTGGAGTVGQGNNGGTNTFTSNNTCGGGGGAGTVGLPTVGVSTGGNGGAGIASAISGTVTTYAGGGGGSGNTGTQGAGGVGGGGAGSDNVGTAGAVNTGGGGGGGWNAAGGGGSGICIISYPDIYSAPSAFGGANSPTASTSGSGSLSLNGTSQYVSYPASANLSCSGNFTLELWLYSTNNNTGTYCIYVGNPSSGSYFGIKTGQYAYQANGGGEKIWSGGVLPLNTWTHIALVRNGSTVTVYQNGSVVTGTATDSNVFIQSAQTLNVGSLNNSLFTYGYISNLRLVNGSAVYTSSFTPPTAPLTPITNTQLLLSTVSPSVLNDSSTNSFTPTPTGSPTWNQTSPFATGLGYKNRVYTWTGSGTVTF
jgi:hypothetical protein